MADIPDEQERAPSSEGAARGNDRAAPYLSASGMGIGKEFLRAQEAMVQQGRALLDGLRQQYLPASASIQELLESRARIGQLAADTIGPSLVDLVGRREEVLGSASGLAIAETMSRFALGDSMITANIAALNAGRQVLDWADSVASARALTAQLSAQFASMKQVARLVEDQNNQLLRLRPSWEIARPASLSTRAYEDVLRSSAGNRSDALLTRVDAAGRTTGWALDAAVRLAAPSVSADLEEATETALGPAGASAELRVRLAAIDSDLPIKLDGAWERIDNGGTDAGRQAAHSLMEAMDWTLRTLAPEEATLAWYAGLDPKPSDALDDRGRPTRSLKFRFIVRDHPEKAFAIDLYLRAIKGLVGSLQDPKHGIRTTDPRTLAPIAQTVESFLLFVVSG